MYFGWGQPRDGAYQSDEPGVIARHSGQAQAADLDGFAVHWFAPGDRTDGNFGQVLNQSPEGFNSTVVDPKYNTWWIAEGLESDYLAVFDGLYVHKIDHACCPNAFWNASRWAGWTRDWDQQTGQRKLWVGTVMPGWDDLNSAQPHCIDLRVSSELFVSHWQG